MQYGFTPLLKNKILQQYFSDEEVTLYVGLFVEMGQPSEVPVEILIDQVSGYKRIPVRFSVPSNGIIYNKEPVTFPSAKTDWTIGEQRVAALGIFDSENGSFTESCIAYLPLSELETILTGQIFDLNPEAIKLQLV